jgi:flavin reductase (DIM6/NTAB) family NADH-FMN oxidoreductase RutF
MDAEKLGSNGELLKVAMRSWASGVAVVTSTCLGARAGTTVSSFTSLSLDPPLVLVNLASENPTQTMIAQSGHFALTLLCADQREVSNLFAGFGKRIGDKFGMVETFTLETGSPLTRGGIAHLDCRVYHICQMPKSVVIIGEVVAGQAEENGNPLLYFNRDYAELCQPGRAEPSGQS